MTQSNPSISRETYMYWLAGHIKTFGTIDNVSDKPFNELQDIQMLQNPEGLDFPLHGSDSRDFLVPKKQNTLPQDTGHCGFYFLDGFRVEGIHSITLPADIPPQDVKALSKMI